MCVLFFDVKENDPMIIRGTLDYINFTENLYADDTLLILKDAQTANHLLRIIAAESEYYDMRFNRDRCKTISTSLRNNVTFDDGKNLENVDQEKYFGGILHRIANQPLEINSESERRSWW